MNNAESKVLFDLAESWIKQTCHKQRWDGTVKAVVTLPDLIDCGDPECIALRNAANALINQVNSIKLGIIMCPPDTPVALPDYNDFEGLTDKITREKKSRVRQEEKSK